jgi:glycolate oxidase FAD binding subunit
LSGAGQPVAIERPGSIEQASELLRELGAAGRPLRVRGGGTKMGWASSGAAPQVELQTDGLARVIEHNQGDFTAVLEAGVPLAQAREDFAAAGQMLALDPPLGADRATIGGVLATADSGPMRHRYGAVRDLVLGLTVVLSDGTVGKSGGRVIKNVAGYDLGKLFTGSFGTLGLIATVSVRLHPLPERTATARAGSGQPEVIGRAAAALAASPLEADCLDAAWEAAQGTVLVRFSGPSAADQARSVASQMGELGLHAPEVIEPDAELWERQRSLQRSADGTVVKVADVITGLEAALRAARETGSTLVSRAGLGLSWIGVESGGDLAGCVRSLRERLPGATLTVLDGAQRLDDPWPDPAPGALAVMQRLKARFDPGHVFAPGAFVGGL